MRTAALLSGLFMLGGLLVSGCGSSDDPKPQATFSTIQKNEVFPIDNNGNPAQMTVIRNEVQWAEFWSLLYTSYSPKPALPTVNFSESVIVAVVDTLRPSGGYSITITAIQPTPTGVTVKSSQVSPGQGCVVTQALTKPFHIVTTPAFTGAATLELSQSVNNCRQ